MTHMKINEPVVLFCEKCKKESVSYIGVKELDDTFGAEYRTECSKCDNWEIGDLPFQGFDILRYLS